LTKVLLASRSEDVFELVEEEVEELLSVTLDGSVGWVAFKVFVRVAEFSWINVAFGGCF